MTQDEIRAVVRQAVRDTLIELGIDTSDNRATMHRGRPFDDAAHRRELRRVTTLDIETPAA